MNNNEMVKNIQIHSNSKQKAKDLKQLYKRMLVH